MTEEMIGHYRIVAELGRGGMGVVYKAHEESLNRFVAIKVLGDHLSQDPDYVARFVREAQSAAKLSHPNIVQIYFIGEDAGRHYFVMEYVSGSSVQQLLRADGRMATARAARLVLQAASGLAAAHDRGIIHRDIKPANLILSESGVLKIADFGLALMPDAATRLTVSGMFMGTPGYLSPEQCSDADIDGRTDIYSLGVTYYEMLTGTMPFRADSPLALIKKIAEVEPPPVAELNPEVDEDTRAILGRMMAKDRDQRFADAHQLVDALEDWVAAHGGRREGVVSATNVVAAPPPLPSADAQTLNTSPTVAVDSGAGRVSAVAGEAAAAAPEPPPEVPVAPPTPPPAAGWPDEEAAAAVAPPPGRRAASRNTAVVVAILVVVGLLLLGGAGVVAWRTGLLGKAWRMARGGPAAEQATPAAVDESQPPATGDETTGQEGVATGEPEGAPEETGPAPFAAGGSEEVATQVEESPTPVPAAAGGAASAPVIRREAPPAEMHPARRSGGGETTAARQPRAAASLQQQAIAAPPPPPAHGTALVVTGERLLAGEVESFLQQRLQAAGVELLDPSADPAVAALTRGGATPSAAAAMAGLRGHAARLVLVEVDYLGERPLRYMGRYETSYQARVSISAYDVGSGQAVMPGFSERLDYTQLNVGQAVEKALVGEAADLGTRLAR